MGTIRYSPKNYNPNWSKFSSKRKLWNKSQKQKNNGTGTKTLIHTQTQYNKKDQY